EDEFDNLQFGSGDAPGFSTAPPSGHPLGEPQDLISGFQFGPCGSQQSKGVFAPDGDYSSGVLEGSAFAKRTCGNGNGDVSPSDEGDTPVEKNLLNESPPDIDVDPGEINVGDGPVDTMGGNSELEELKR